LMINTE